MAEAAIPEVTTDQMVDEYKLINGIGPAVEKRLHDAGILSYAQLAALKPSTLNDILFGMVGFSAERVKEQDWIGQAVRLAENAGQTLEVGTGEPIDNSLHYASYTFELLLDAGNNVRRTRAMHVQTRAESSWAGWDQDKLIKFLVESGELGDLLMKAPQKTSADQSVSGSQLPGKRVAKGKRSEPELQLLGSARVSETSLQSSEGKPLGALIPSRQPFVVRLELDLSQLEAPKDERLSFDAIIYKKRIGNAKRECIGNLEGSLPKGERAVIEVDTEPLADGDYRLEALVAVRPQSMHKGSKRQLMAISEGMLLHVF